MTVGILEKPIAKTKSLWAGVFIESAKWATPVAECAEEPVVEPVKDEAPVWTMPVFEEEVPTTSWFDIPSFKMNPVAGFTDGEKPVTDWISLAFDRHVHDRYRNAQQVGADVIIRFKEAVRQVIMEAGPEFVCQPHVVNGVSLMRYVSEGKGDCLVGRAMIQMGYSPAEIARYESQPAYMVIPQVMGRNEELVRIASDVQMVNDTRQQWGQALRYV